MPNPRGCTGSSVDGGVLWCRDGEDCTGGMDAGVLWSMGRIVHTGCDEEVLVVRMNVHTHSEASA